MDFYIHKSAIQYSQSLLCSNNQLVKVDERDIPQGALIYGTPGFEEVMKLYDQPIPEFPPRNYLKAYEGVLKTTPSSRVPWSSCIPDKAYTQSVRVLAKEILDSFGAMNDDLGYYQKTYKHSGRILDNLKPGAVDVMKWKELTFRGESQHSSIRSFRPDESGFTEIPRYSRVATVTGRLKVTGGPDILHLKKTHRDILISRFGDNGSIWQLDYKSLEPRVLLALLVNSGTLPEEERNKVHERDIYQDIKDKLFGHLDSLTRDMIKKIVLSELYGAGLESIAKQLPGELRLSEIDDIANTILDWFKLPELKARLIAEYNANDRKYILNAYGRRVRTSEAQPYMLVNYFTQSTAVDVALHGFSNLVDYVNIELRRGNEIVPLSVLHDALFLDIHKNSAHLIGTLCKVGSIDIPGFESSSFYLQGTKLV